MHPMFAELFLKPDEELEAGERRRVRRSRRMRTLSGTGRAPGRGVGHGAGHGRGRPAPARVAGPAMR